MSALSVDAQKRAQKDSAKKEAKAAAAEARAKEAKDHAMVYIKRVERNKRKYVTEVSGLEAHGLDLKKVAKEWGKKCMYFPVFSLPPFSSPFIFSLMVLFFKRIKMALQTPTSFESLSACQKGPKLGKEKSPSF